MLSMTILKDCLGLVDKNMNETSKKKVKLKLPDGISLPNGVELPEIEVSEATIRETIIDDNGKTYEVEKKIEFPVIK